MIEISKPNWLLLSSSSLVSTVQEYYHTHCKNKANCQRYEHDDNNPNSNKNENDEAENDDHRRQDNDDDYAQHSPLINRNFKPVVC